DLSNHGGRQLDHARGSLDDLREVVEAVSGRARLIVDGSIYRGTDIAKAIATGAHMVGIGKLHCLALAAAGESGVEQMLELLEDEMEICLALLGASKLARIDRSYVERNVAPGLHSGLATAF